MVWGGFLLHESRWRYRYGFLLSQEWRGVDSCSHAVGGAIAMAAFAGMVLVVVTLWIPAFVGLPLVVVTLYGFLLDSCRNGVGGCNAMDSCFRRNGVGGCNAMDSCFRRNGAGGCNAMDSCLRRNGGGVDPHIMNPAGILHTPHRASGVTSRCAPLPVCACGSLPWPAPA